MRRARLRLGTRGSRLSLRQTELAADMLRGHAPGGSEVALEVVVIQTAGDRAPDVPLEHLDGIGFFARELEAALVDGRCDLAVHSAKDLPTEIHDGLVLGAFTPRADPRDVLVAAPGRWLATLPPGASVATSSVRRSAQILHFRPDLRTVPIRGNIDTRLGKLDRGVYDALCLAGAGLVRMEWQERITEWLEPEIMLPAPGQGALVLEVRRGDDDLVEWLGGLDDKPTRIAVEAERAFVARLGSGCRAPAAALATVARDSVTLEGLIALPDGSVVRRHRATRPIGEAGELGTSVADHLLADAGFALDVARLSASAGLPGIPGPPAAPKDGRPRGATRKDRTP